MSKSKAKSEGGDDENDDADEDDDDDDEDEDEDEDDQEYTEEEVVRVGQCVELFKQVADLLKLGLQTMSTVADRVDSEGGVEPVWANWESWEALSREVVSMVDTNDHPPQQHSGTLDSLPVPSSAATIPSSAEQLPVAVKKSLAAKFQCRRWVLDLLRLNENISTVVTDLGVELYPSLDETTIGVCVETLKRTCHELLAKLSLHEYHNLLSDSMKEQIAHFNGYFAHVR